MVCRTCQRLLIKTVMGAWEHQAPARHQAQPIFSPRGVPTWPHWRKAKPGTRVRTVRDHSGTGTFVKPSNSKHNGAIVDWDDRGFGPSRGYVISPAFDLEVIPED